MKDKNRNKYLKYFTKLYTFPVIVLNKSFGYRDDHIVFFKRFNFPEISFQNVQLGLFLLQYLGIVFYLHHPWI